MWERFAKHLRILHLPTFFYKPSRFKTHKFCASEVKSALDLNRRQGRED